MLLSIKNDTLLFPFKSTPISSTNKTDRHDITEILLKMTLNTKTPNTEWVIVVKRQVTVLFLFTWPLLLDDTMTNHCLFN
jgi:hypothetical protein